MGRGDSLLNPLPQTLHVSGNSVFQCSESESSIREDPRGVLFLWEEPISWAKYIIGCDPTVGITGWSRASRIEEDKKKDNGAIEVFRVDAIPLPLFRHDGKPDYEEFKKDADGNPLQKFIWRDLQVAEYAAPCDATELARALNVIGRIYAGNERDQCEIILETFPGPGMLTLQELIRLGYTNLWQWEKIADGVAEQTNAIGWHSHHQSQSILWTRARRHMMMSQAKILSPYLFAEYQNAIIDPGKQRAVAPYGYHDDRIQAASMAFWAGHKWTYDVERTAEPVTEAKEMNWQTYAPTFDDDLTSWKDSAAALLDTWG